jgi:hypothetical protein
MLLYGYWRVLQKKIEQLNYSSWYLFGQFQKPYQNFEKIQNTSKKLKNWKIIFYQKTTDDL